MAEPDPEPEASARARQRRAMVEQQMAGRGLRDRAVLGAMGRVRRDAFVPETMRDLAYEDTPLPIGEGQTISQPYMVAAMTEALALQSGDRVLEIGTGSGYAAAVLAEIAAEVFTIERFAALADRARETLRGLGCANVTVVAGDGTKGLPEHAPFDAIVVTAGGPRVPSALRDQLAVGGRLVIPIGRDQTFQHLVRVTKSGEEDFDEETLMPVRFVPLVGDEGWPEDAGEARRDRWLRLIR